VKAFWLLHRSTLMLSTFAVLLTAAFHVRFPVAAPSGVFALVAMLLYCPVLVLMIDALVKRVRYGRMLQRQKYLKLSFSTRLGMHSPVGALEEVAPEVTSTYKPSANYMGKWASKMFHLLSLEDGEGELECECCERPIPN
jgi:hypothetical protein